MQVGSVQNTINTYKRQSQCLNDAINAAHGTNGKEIEDYLLQNLGFDLQFLGDVRMSLSIIASNLQEKLDKADVDIDC